MAVLRGPSVAVELLEPLAGSKPLVSEATAMVMLPPAFGCLPDGDGGVVACTCNRLPCGLGLAIVVAEPGSFLVVLVVDPALAVVAVAPAAAVVVVAASPTEVLVSPATVVVVSSRADVVAVVFLVLPPPHAAATRASETVATPKRQPRR